MPGATVTVRGQAIVTGQPDEARVFITVSSRRPTPEEALREVANQSEELERILNELSIDESARRTSGASVAADSEYDGQAKRYVHLGYRASNQVNVRLGEGDRIGRLIREVTDRIGAQILGPEWHLALTNPAFTEAARSAAEDAKRKAEAYASALGVRLGTVERVSEPYISSRRHDYLVDASPAAYSSPDPEIEIHEGTLDVAGAVEVTFNLDQA